MIVKTIISHMQSYVKETDVEEEVEPTLKSLEIRVGNQAELMNVSKLGVLLDGGASHNVNYSAKTPPGVVEKRSGLSARN